MQMSFLFFFFFSDFVSFYSGLEVFNPCIRGLFLTLMGIVRLYSMYYLPTHIYTPRVAVFLPNLGLRIRVLVHPLDDF